MGPALAVGLRRGPCCTWVRGITGGARPDEVSAEGVRAPHPGKRPERVFRPGGCPPNCFACTKTVDGGFE
jgi:hypothetical protein